MPPARCGQSAASGHSMGGNAVNKGGLPVRRMQYKGRRRLPLRLYAALLAAAVTAAGLWFNAYINTEIKPELQQLAEYYARAETLEAMHRAVQQTLQERPLLGGSLYRGEEDRLQLDAAQANAVRSALTAAVETQLALLPQQEYCIPFGSLTGNSLLSGWGPGWAITLQPQGYVQAEWEETTESLSINTTRVSAALVLTVTVNMILDGRTETLTVRDTVPLASVLLRGDTPQVYAAALD